MSWSPPDHPDPSTILHSAVEDTRTGSHAQALTKFVWFHHNALRYGAGLTGVRLSFALTYWTRLAAVYPPAREAFVRTRDETDVAFRTDLVSFSHFHDLAALNRFLREPARTADLFAEAARNDRTAAQRLYQVAEPSLIAVGRYEACGPFLDPSTRMRSASHMYEVTRSLEDEEPTGELAPPKMAALFYTRDVATLVALLVLNHRAEEAERVRQEGFAVVHDEEFRALLSAAMLGQLPPPLLVDEPDTSS